MKSIRLKRGWKFRRKNKMDDYIAIHFCGGEYVCCDGDCGNCAKHAFVTTDATGTEYVPGEGADK